MGLRLYANFINQKSYLAFENKDFENATLIEDEEKLELDKSWHAISYLLTDNPDLEFLDCSIEVEMGEAMVCVFSPAKVAEYHNYFTSLEVDDICAKYDVETFNQVKIYPEHWEAKGIDYIISYLSDLFDYFKRAKESGYGVLAIIS